MTRATWRKAWLQDSARRIDEARVWRGVETQYLSATTLLVDSSDEHDLLEGLLEASKPPLPAKQNTRKHYLLLTPFRYIPHRPSRFRPFGRRGIWYGSLKLRTACAEVAYWRTVFIRDSAGLKNQKIVSQHTFFQARVAGTGIDLTASPWHADRALWISEDYTATHQLSRAVEAAGAQVIQYESARSPGDCNLAVLAPEALDEPPDGLNASQQGWTFSATADRVLMQSNRDAADKFEWKR